VLRLAWTDHQDADLDVDQYGTLRTDGGMETLGVFALFVDSRPAKQDLTSDPLGQGAAKLGGWWMHQLLAPDVRLDRAPGSLLHRLQSYKANAGAARRAKTWSEQALQWLVDAGLADRVEAEATVAGGRLDLEVKVYRGQAQVFRALWDGVNG
jgi:phage gp46-like protein